MLTTLNPVSASRFNKVEPLSFHNTAQVSQLAQKNIRQQPLAPTTAFRDVSRAPSPQVNEKALEKFAEKAQDPEFLKQALSHGASFIERFEQAQYPQDLINEMDVLTIFFRLLVLVLTNREQEKLSQRMEREIEVRHMKEVVTNYLNQGNFQQKMAIGIGMSSILSGLLLVVGQTRLGDWAHGKLGNGDKDVWFEGLSKTAQGGSQMTSSIADVNRTFSEGERTYNQQQSDLARINQDRSKDTLHENSEYTRSIFNFLEHFLQMRSRVVQSLYN